MSDAIDEGRRTLLRLQALASAPRLRILGLLREAPLHISEMARQLQISRPLLSMHLARLEAARLVKSEAVLGEDGRAYRYFSLEEFELHITGDTLPVVPAQDE